jgi:hypothetical protein
MLGIYENKLECLWNSGFYSNVHQTFSAILTLLSHGISPDNISFEHGFKNYKLNPKQDIYPFFYKLNPDQELPIWKNLYRVSANETSNNVINTLPFFEYNQIINKYFLPSERILSIIDNLKYNYHIDLEKTISIFYRGTDKFTEVSIAEPKKYAEVAKNILSKNPDYRILIQTDQKQVLDYFLNEFGDKAFYFKEIPTTTKTGNDTVKMESIPNRWMNFFEDSTTVIDPIALSQNLEAAIRIISQSKYLVLHTGNGALFSILYRGNSNNIFQFNELGQLNGTENFKL